MLIDKFDPETKHEAKFLLESFTSFKICLTAFIFLKVFETSTPASLYLQTKRLNMLTAFKMVDEATRFLKKESREFEKIYAQTEFFFPEVNDLLLPLEIKLILTDKSNRIESNQIENGEHPDSTTRWPQMNGTLQIPLKISKWIHIMS